MEPGVGRENWGGEDGVELVAVFGEDEPEPAVFLGAEIDVAERGPVIKDALDLAVEGGPVGPEFDGGGGDVAEGAGGEFDEIAVAMEFEGAIFLGAGGGEGGEEDEKNEVKAGCADGRAHNQRTKEVAIRGMVGGCSQNGAKREKKKRARRRDGAARAFAGKPREPRAQVCL